MLGLEPVRAACLQWVEGEPFCEDFGDIYFSRGDGLAESRYVFLDNNGLPQRWTGKSRFVVGETGFGTGLNFLALCQVWKDHRPPGGRLHFVSVERFPLRLEDLKKALGRWPELAEDAETLCRRYPPLLPGPHRLRMGHGITLDLWFGDALDCIGQWDAGVDAWFLDGFDPARNPAMWSGDLFDRMARCTAPGGTFATFTVAGRVRRAAEAAGFAIEKTPGHGRKRQMLRGVLARRLELLRAPWYLPPEPKEPEQVVVIGAGIAGAACAKALRRRGVAVTVLDAAGIATGASGNPAGAVSPAPVSGQGPYGAFYRDAFVHAVRELEAADFPEGVWNPVGLLQMAGRETRRKRLLEAPSNLGLEPGWARWLDRREAGEQIGHDLPDGGLWLPRAGWLRPVPAIRAWLEGIPVVSGWALAEMKPAPGGWALTNDQGETRIADHVILAAAMGSRGTAYTRWLPLEPVRGQVSLIRGVPALDALRPVVCHEGYVIPGLPEGCLIGAGYGRGEDATDIREREDAFNLDTLERQWPQVLQGDTPMVVASRAAVRATTPDRIPLIGACPDQVWAEIAYARLHQGPKAGPWPPMAHCPGLYVATGFGSRGLTAAFLGAELLVSRLLGEPLPMTAGLVDALNPARFVYRAMKRPPSTRRRIVLP